MTAHTIIYDVEGRIQSNYFGAPGMLSINTPNGHAALQVDKVINAAKYFVDITDTGAVLTERPVIPLIPASVQLTIGEVLALSGIPVGTTVYHPDGVDIVDDGSLEWVSTVPGQYKLHLHGFPYQDEEIRIEVTP